MNTLKRILYLFLYGILFSSCLDTMKEAEYSGKDITNDFTIQRDKNTKAASIIVKNDKSWKLYAGTQVNNIDFSKPIAEGKKAGIYPIYNINNLSRYYFQVVTSKGKAILAERILPISNAYNYRDLGGYKNKDGRYIKWGKIFRAGDMVGLSDTDIKYLESIPIVTVFDMRLAEDQKHLEKLPITVREYYRHPISFDNARTMITAGISTQATEEYISKLMEFYKKLVVDSTSIAQTRHLFECLQDEKNTPVIYFASVAKDRIGVVSALILASLNVDESVIMQDYMFSNFCLEDKYKTLTDKYPYLKTLYDVHEEYLNYSLSIIKKEYGSIEKYLKDVLHVDMEKMQKLYLVK